MSGLEARIALEVGRVITNSSNFPPEMRVHMWGRDLSEPIDKIIEALAPVIREAQAEAWDKGAFDASMSLDHGGHNANNPYQEEP